MKVSSFFLAACLCLPLSADAATFIFTSEQTSLKVNEQFVVSVYLDVGTENVNALEGAVTYDANILTLTDVKEADSVINFWVVDPRAAVASPESGTVAFSGVTPGGLANVLVPSTDGSPSGKLFTAVFTAKKQGTATISVTDGVALLNDGLGTAVPTFVMDEMIRVRGVGEAAETEAADDVIEPEAFSVEVARDENIFDGQWFAVFYAGDKQSGIDHYELQEGVGEFVVATSPYVLHDQSGNIVVNVRAFDRAGNERNASSSPQHFFAQYLGVLFWSILAAIIVTLTVLLRRVWRRGRPTV